MDWDDIFGDSNEQPTNPREIFGLLDKQPRFEFLRDVQADILDGWYRGRDQRDTVIKLDTGGGKTTSGLLMLQSCINEDVYPAVYLTPDKYLTEQVLAEAEALGIEATDNADDPRVRGGSAIYVTNIFKLFNGKSIFGVGRKGIRLKIGAIIIDDAHACLATVANQFRIRLKSDHPAYGEIGKLFETALGRQSPSAALSIKAGDPHDYLEVPFWDVREKADELLQILTEYEDTDELAFNYPFLADHLHLCRIVIGGKEIEIEPLFPIPSMIPAFEAAKRRIYMSATLADDSVFVTHFGADPETLSDPVTPDVANAMGDRMILLPKEINRDIKREEIKQLIVDLAQDKNCVVIVPSKRSADDWRGIATEVLIGDQVSPGVARLLAGHVGLVVLVNRYDGVDLPHDACRVLVIDGLPEANSLIERTDNVILGNGTVGLRRQIERIEQGMGRGVRSVDDHCVVLLLGARLTERLLSAEGKPLLSNATRKQIDIAQRMAAQSQGDSASDLSETMMLCLDQKKVWTAGSRKARASIRPDKTLRLDETSVNLRRAFDSAWLDDDQSAAEILKEESKKATDPGLKAWLLVREAFHMQSFDPTAAQARLVKARRFNTQVLRPLVGVDYEALRRREIRQAEASQAYLGRMLEAYDRVRFVDALAEDLQFRPDTSEPFEQAIDDAGRLIGLSCQRPEKRFGEGPDNIWHLHGDMFAVIECKNGVTSQDGISKKDLGQLQQSMTWFDHLYGAVEAVPVIVHPHSKAGPTASVPKGTRVMTPKDLKALKKAMTAFIRALASDESAIRNVERIAALLAENNLNGEMILEHFTRECS